MRNRSFIIIPLMIICFTSAFSQIIDKDVSEAMQAFEQLDYQRAKTLAEQILASWKNYNINELAEMHKILGVIYYSNGNLNDAEDHFEQALSLNAQTQLDSVLISPKIISFFNEVKSEFVPAQSQPSNVRYILVRDTRPAATVRSFFIPGWGQIYKGHKKKGYILAAATSLSLITWGTFYIMQDNAHDDYLDATLPDDIENKYDRYNRLYKAQQVSALTTGFFWLYSLTDALLSPPPEHQRSFTCIPVISQDLFVLRAIIHF